ncbi:MAG: glycoside hydrolase family 3 N-terminal domain-containing protein [Bacteroidota bacterium]
MYQRDSYDLHEEEPPFASPSRQTTLLDRVTALTIVICVIAIPAWVTITFSSSEPVSQDTYDQYLEGKGAWARATLNKLTLEQKVSQLFFPYAYGVYQSSDDPAYKRLVDLVERFEVGGVVFFQGDPFSQAQLANDLQNMSNLPLITSQDMETGAGFRLKRTTHFPSAMAFGASRNTDLAYSAGLITAREARALGVYQVFAPVADINNNADNPVINIRSYGERANLVADMVTAFTFGLQDGNVIATVKHFPGHGDTATDSHSDLPILPFTRARLDSVELVPFRAARDAGIMSVMMGHLALPELEPDTNIPATLAPAVVNSLLREEMGFKGLIVSDAMRMSGITKSFGTGESAVRAIEAGVDILVMSQDEYAARAAILRAVEEGRLTEERIDQSVMRLLTTKEWLGLNRNRLLNPSSTRQIVATNYHKMISETVARESVTLLSNQRNLLPLKQTPRRVAIVTISDSDEPERGQYFNSVFRSLATRSSVSNYLIDTRSTNDDYNKVLSRARNADLIIIPTYRPFRSGTNRIALPARIQSFMNRLVRQNKPTILVSFGSPYLVNDLTRQPNVYIAAYGESESSEKAVAQAMFGQTAIKGKLPITIPGLYQFGEGIQVPQLFAREGYPEEVGMSSASLSRVDSLINASIADQAFPGAAIAIGRPDVLVKLQGYGYYTYDSERRVAPTSKFDLASLTKVVATTTAIMQLYEQGKLKLDDKIAKFLPNFGQNGKDGLTVRHLLTHTSGMTPFRPFHQEGITTRSGIIDAIFSEELIYAPGTEMRYSDFNMIVLALLVEKISGQNFGTYTTRNIFAPLGMNDTGFRRSGVGSDQTVVPTEVDQNFRKRLVQGEVHDETAYSLGGTAGHAGLFSTAKDLSKFAFMMMNEGKHNGQAFLKEETVRLFTAAVDGSRHSRALGWDTKSPEGYSSAGQLFSTKSFGHTGFTGTSLWIDPEADLFVILLTNRVYPTRDNKKHSAVRAKLADIAYESITGENETVLPKSTN